MANKAKDISQSHLETDCVQTQVLWLSRHLCKILAYQKSSEAKEKGEIQEGF